MTTQNLTWHQTQISKEQRREANRHDSYVIWLTGLSGSGKSTLATELERRLFTLGTHVYLLDGDNMRMGLNADLGFSDDDRQENIRRVSEVAKLFVDAGLIVIAATISPFQNDREVAKRKFSNHEFIEVYVDCPLDICVQRDPKGLYKKAQTGLITNFTGVDSPYEPPVDSDITVQTHQKSVSECVEQIMRFLGNQGLAPIPVGQGGRLTCHS